MNAGPERRGEPCVARDNQHQPACAADPDEIATECGTVRFSIMAQDDAREAPRETLSGGAWVGEAACVGEQPERWQAGLGTDRGSTRPGKKASVHGVSGFACATRAAVLTRSQP